jgi:hypothetical protein
MESIVVTWRLTSLEDLSLRARILLFVIIVFIVTLLLMFVPTEGEPAEQLYQGVPLNAHLLQVDKDALDQAYKEQLKLLFSVWLKDDVSVVHRINTGLQRARQAYAHAAEQIEKRERALQKR